MNNNALSNLDKPLLCRFGRVSMETLGNAQQQDMLESNIYLFFNYPFFKVKKMKAKTFEVPSELLPEFSGLLAELELVNEIQGTNDDDEIIVEVSYGTKQKEALEELSDWLEDALEDFYEEDEDEDEDDE